MAVFFRPMVPGTSVSLLSSLWPLSLSRRRRSSAQRPSVSAMRRARFSPAASAAAARVSASRGKAIRAIVLCRPFARPATRGGGSGPFRSIPRAMFGLLFGALILLLLLVKAFEYRKSHSGEGGEKNAFSLDFSAFQMKYLTVYLVVMFADWLQVRRAARHRCPSLPITPFPASFPSS